MNDEISHNRRRRKKEVEREIKRKKKVIRFHFLLLLGVWLPRYGKNSILSIYSSFLRSLLSLHHFIIIVASVLYSNHLSLFLQVIGLACSL
ncbi:hypothetical protein P8452_34777 [Trifolium repens]|nr:hypothetical protein P8452_34777 [Trifolium repens]